MLNVRRVKPEDRSRVLEIAAKIWEDDDYIPAIFDNWVEDKSNIFAAAVHEENLVGFGRMCELGQGDFWLEGLRKDPDYEITGIGKAISDYMFDKLKSKQISSLRFSTYFDNVASVKINEKRGFKRILTLSLKMRDLKSEYQDFKRIDPKPELDELITYLEKSNYLKLCQGFLAKGWVVYPFSSALIKIFLAENRVAVYRENDKICGVLIATDTHYVKEWWISFLEGESAEITQTLLSYADWQAKQQNKKELLVLLPEECEQKKVCLKDGFGSWEQEKDFYLYELPLELL